MARPKNLKNREDIALAAFKLFIEKGYYKTTYKEIALLSKNTKPLVQYFYPQKEILLENFVLRILKFSTEYIDSSNLKSNDNFVNLYIIGQIHFSFLLTSEDMSLLACDIFENRRFTQRLIYLDEIWTFDYLSGILFEKEEMAFSTIMAIGGAYEVGYRILKKGEKIDIPKLMKRVMVIFMIGLGVDSQVANGIFKNYEMSQNEFDKANKYILKHLLAKV